MSSNAKIAVVTGCSSGIGLATTKVFLEVGYKVFGIDIAAFDPKNFSSPNDNFFFHQANLTSTDVPKAAIEACKDRFGTVDVLANVAGVMDSFQSADTVTEEDLQRVMSINLTVPILLMKEVIKIMKEGGQGGSIVNVSSKAGMSGAVAGIAYTASKHGLIGATKNVAWRFKDENIRCNVVSPGAVVTNISSSMTKLDDDGFTACRDVINLHTDFSDPSKTKIQAVDVANAILFMASEKAVSISGVVLPVDCAWSTI